jgi:hypothetical protein
MEIRFAEIYFWVKRVLGAGHMHRIVFDHFDPE